MHKADAQIIVFQVAWGSILFTLYSMWIVSCNQFIIICYKFIIIKSMVAM